MCLSITLVNNESHFGPSTKITLHGKEGLVFSHSGRIHRNTGQVIPYSKVAKTSDKFYFTPIP
jgi:hypothetical protein